MIILSSLGAERQPNIREMAAPNWSSEKERLGFGPQDFFTPQDIDQIIEVHTQYVEGGNLGEALNEAGMLTTLFPETKYRIPVTADHFVTYFTHLLSNFQNNELHLQRKAMEMITLFANTRALFPREVERAVFLHSEVTQVAKEAIVEASGSPRSAKQHKAWQDAAEWSVACGQLFDTSRLLSVENMALASARESLAKHYWQEEDAMTWASRNFLAVRLFSNWAAADIRPPAEVWPTVVGHVEARKRRLDANNCLVEVLQLMALMASEITVDKQGLALKFLPSVESKIVESSPPPPRRSF